MDLAKDKRGHFLYRLFCLKGIWKERPQCIVHWIHFQNIHTFTYQKNILYTLLLLVFKIVESLQCMLNKIQYLSININISTFIDFADLEYSKLAFITIKKNVSWNFGGSLTWFYLFRKKKKQIYERSTISAFQLNFVQYTAIQQSYKLPWPSREK